jgi:hypothetical protein
MIKYAPSANFPLFLDIARPAIEPILGNLSEPEFYPAPLATGCSQVAH